MATESLNASGPIRSGSEFSADLQASITEANQKRPNNLQTMLKKLIALLTPSPEKRKPLTPEDQIIASLAEKHSTIFMT
jgi:hypothetical protein